MPIPEQPALSDQTDPIDPATNRFRARSDWFLRALMGLTAILPIGLLGVAGSLRPNSAGLGTHQQLGLPPCSMRVIFGIRCPACGMTTSWSYFTRGQWPASAEANIAGFLLALIAVAFSPIAIRAAITGRMPSRGTQRYATLALVSIAAIASVQWLVRLWVA
ncbi:DUF2752 domain-containing protein [Rubripirellula lacrimiformis]|uniref:DUF2752 domain-containing protein n=1 Tax=Rubripirellula lacrimiformis TaxID=1930273 RepID=UPI0011A8B506|nr:DUF2752 domain-containing protein [Rubripirellula lacrimiformis]